MFSVEGETFKVSSDSWTREIALAGLRHWHPRAEARLNEFLAAVVRSMNSGECALEFVKRGFDAVNDPRWLEVIYRTTLFAMQEECRHDPVEGEPACAEYRQVWSSACYVPGHYRFDRFCASAQSDVWRKVRAPFGWLCACNVVPMFSKVDLLLPARKLRVRSLLVAQSGKWLMCPPSDAYERL